MDERKEFFRDLAALRGRLGLSLADIADRTQFPVGSLAAVESGPDVPPLPDLEAYLRGCGEPLAAWEDRWRQLGQGAAAVAGSGEDLPVRDAGTSPLAAAGAAAAGAAATADPEACGPVAAGAGGAEYTIKRLGTGSGQGRSAGGSRQVGGSRSAGASRRRVAALTYAAAAGAAVLLGGGGVALLAWGHAAGHHGTAGAAPRSAGPRSAGVPSAGVPSAGVPSAGMSSASAPIAGVPAASKPPGGRGAGSAPARGARTPGPSPAPGAGLLQVAGVGCPQDSVTVADAPAGPGWTASGGGWTGDGCDGSAMWTMDPNGNQRVPSALTWKFGLAAGVSHCTLAVFVPTLNALGVGEYAVSTGATATVSVAVSQAAAAGQWVTLGSYPVQGSSLQIQLAPAVGAAGAPGPAAHGRGHVTGQGPGHNSAIAASAARAACG